MNCPNCEAEINKEAKACPECGESLEAVEDSKEKAPVLTKEELLAGLRGSARKAAPNVSLPSEHWGDYTASLLEVLFNKHLVFPAEFNRELKTDKEDE